MQYLASLLREAFRTWTVETIGRDLVLNLVGGFASGILIFLIARRWDLILSYLTRERAAFRRVFGASTLESGQLTITLDVYRDLRLLVAVEAQVSRPAQSMEQIPPTPEAAPTVAEQTAPAAEQASPQKERASEAVGQEGQPVEKTGEQGQPASAAPGYRFFKLFPDRHITMFPGATEGILGYCSARAAAYLIDSLRGIRGVSVRAVADQEVSNRWDGAFVNIGSSYSNIKSDDIKHLPHNPWLREDGTEFTFKDGGIISLERRADKGIVMKIENPYFPGFSLLICAGLGEWGTSGSAWYLAQHWKTLSHRFGRRPFLLVVAVTPGSDQSAREILWYGRESWLFRLRRRLF